MLVPHQLLFFVGLFAIFFASLSEGFSCSQSSPRILTCAQTQAGLSSSRWKTESIKNSKRHEILLLGTLGSDATPLDNGKAPLFEPVGVGLRRDYARRLPFYKSDITDGLNAQTLASTLFLFFACLAPAIGFGSVSQIATSGQMGVLEMCASTALCGTVYALAAAQPMQIIGPMGPVLAYEISLYQLAKQWQLPFLAFHGAVGVWTAIFLLLCSLTSASNLVRFLTRFTDETFSVVISTIFLLGAIADVSSTFAAGSSPVIALLTLTCCSLTFGIPILLRSLPTTSYFNAATRKNLANFAPAISVAVGSLAARAARLNWNIALPVLELPTKFATTTGRPWLVSFNQLPTWAALAAALPALLATVLLFLDQNITARIANHPRFKQIKGRDTDDLIAGMHGDMFIASILIAVTSLLGLPWMSGATTRTAAHVRSLTLSAKDGTITGCLEQRVSNAAIHVLIGMAIILTAPRLLLQQVPLAAISGVFLFLGFTSLQGLQLWDRINELFQDKSAAASKPWAKLPRKVVAGFTLTQIACVAAMIKLSRSKFGVASPLIIGVLPVLRWGLLKTGLIKTEAMSVLDNA